MLLLQLCFDICSVLNEKITYISTQSDSYMSSDWSNK